MTDQFALLAPFACWAGPLSEVPDDAFSQGLLGPGLALDPLEDLVRAPCDGIVAAIAAAGHAITLRHASGAEVLLHIGIDTVQLAGRGFTCLTRLDATVRAGDPLLRIDPRIVARGARSLISPLVVLGDRYELFDQTPPGPIAAGAPLTSVRAMALPKAAGSAADLRDAERRSLRIGLPHGLHARPAAQVAAVLRSLDAEVDLIVGDRRANARSVTALLRLNAGFGSETIIEARGKEASPAIERVMALLTDGSSNGVRETESPAAAISSAPDGSISGIRAAPGGAIGVAVRQVARDLPLPDTIDSAAEEQAALASALSIFSARLQARSGDDIAAAHLGLACDPELLATVSRRIAAGLGAAAAWRGALRDEATELAATGNPMLAARGADLLDVERQVLEILLGAEEDKLELPHGTVLIADEIMPSAFHQLDTSRLVGIATARGGATSHAAIMAAQRGLPMLVGCGEAIHAIADGTRLIIDDDAPRLLVAPDADAEHVHASRAAQQQEAERSALSQAADECATLDGRRIQVFANCGSVEDADEAVSLGAEGCGLLRSEFLFLGSAEPPDESAQAEIYRRIAQSLADRPLIVRLLDAGSDKPLAFLPKRAEANPALGLRGIRLLLAEPALLEVQIAAILRGVPAGQRRIMLPMVSDIAEVRAARIILRQQEARLGIIEPTPFGVMIETPAAALCAELLASEADFFSIGTNDLAQYVMAADRQDGALASCADAAHPAVLRLIAMATEGAGRHGREVGVCGGFASEPAAAALLVGLGVDELSVIARAVPAVKAAVRRIEIGAARDLARQAVSSPSAQAVRDLLREFGDAHAN